MPRRDTAVLDVAIAALERVRAHAPLRLVVDAGRIDGLAPFERIGAGIAALGVLLT